MQKAQIIGADEVGYGCWAGPLCVGAVRAPEDWHLLGLNDSKQVTKRNREKLATQLWKLHDSGEIFISIVLASNQEIDREGVAAVQRRLFVEAINCCYLESATAIVDGTLVLNKAILRVPYQSIIKADTKISTVMAASIVAKVYRDNYMTQQAPQYPEYDLAQNVGYCSPKHQAALEKLGITPLHRTSYKVKAYK